MRNEAETYAVRDGHHHRIIEQLDAEYRRRCSLTDEEMAEELVLDALSDDGGWVRFKALMESCQVNAGVLKRACASLVDAGEISSIRFAGVHWLKACGEDGIQLVGSCAAERMRLAKDGMTDEQIALLMPESARYWLTEGAMGEANQPNPRKRKRKCSIGKMYAALAKLGQATTRDLSERTGVPTCYAAMCMRRLAEKGAVRRVGAMRRGAATIYIWEVTS